MPQTIEYKEPFGLIIKALVIEYKESFGLIIKA